MAQVKSPYSASDEQKLMVHLWSPEIKDNPYSFVMAVFPWGQAGTPLENFSGPRNWQKDELLKIHEHIRMNQGRMAQGLDPIVYKSATTSGRGTGKSALVAWLNLWFMSTRLGGTAINTANTEIQLKSRTWAEVGKWHTLLINSHWFEKTAMSLRPAEWYEAELKKQIKVDTGYFYSQAQLWAEENPDAFAGVHNQNGVLLIFDEASGIPDPIWKVSEGFFTDPVLDRYWFVFSNPRRNTGPFFECFHKARAFWPFRRHLDSRTVEGTDKKVLNDIIEQHGEDSDEARVEVKGEFPRQGDKQFISRSIVAAAVERELVDDPYAPLLMGVDPARYGDDSTVIRWRQGRNARAIPPTIMKGADNMSVAKEVAHLIEKFKPDGVFIDAGNGTGVIDRLRDMKFKGIHEVWFGAKCDKGQWFNKRTEMWDEMREWLKGACIDNNQDLIDDLVGPTYDWPVGSDRMMLEPKEKMKKRGHASPDNADALACTFAMKIGRRDQQASRGRQRNGVANDVDYDIFGR